MATITAQQTKNVTLNVTNEELGHAVFQVAWVRAGSPDDAGCDWYTDGARTCIGGDSDWCVSNDPWTATLVDAANVLRYGHAFHIEAGTPAR